MSRIRPGRLVIAVGMVPVNWLFWRSKLPRFTKLPIVPGMLPVSALPARSRTPSWERVSMVSGI